MYRVIIVEDDKMVAAINRQYVEMNLAFEVKGMFGNGVEALGYLENHGADLVVLDYYMPRMDGMEFLTQVHKLNLMPEIIMVTAANEYDTVRRLLAEGVLDYLVKPFDYARFEQALQKFIKRRELLDRATNGLTQAELDQLLGMGSDAAASKGKSMQKGMQEHTLDTIRAYMKHHPEMGFTSEELASQVGLSRVTVRRYLNYLVEIHEIVSTIDYRTGGRPSILYRWGK